MNASLAIGTILAILGLVLLIVRIKSSDRLPLTPIEKISLETTQAKTEAPKLSTELQQEAGPIVRDLSESGVVSVAQQIDQYMTSQNWAEAEKWALHATESRPDDIEIQLKLAEIYCNAGMPQKFSAHFENIHRVVFVKDEQSFAKLIALAEQVIPDHIVVRRAASLRTN